MRRRAFITLVGGAILASPLAARAQQTAMPLVGYLSLTTASAVAARLVAFKQGLSAVGFTEGRNVSIEYRFGESQFAKLPELAADLVRRKPSVIVAAGPPSVRAVLAHTSTIPIVFFVGEDPVKEGIVPSLNRPGPYITGISGFANQLFPKRLQLLHEIVAKPAPFALLVNPNNPNAEPDAQDARAAAAAIGRELHVLSANNGDGIEQAFASLVQQQVGGLVVGVDGLFIDRRDQVFALAARHAIPAIYDRREYAVAGGLMSYSANDKEQYGQVGTYVGRILKGAKPSELPVLLAAKFEFVINLRTARVLGLTIPPGVLAIADEVIE